MPSCENLVDPFLLPNAGGTPLTCNQKKVSSILVGNLLAKPYGGALDCGSNTTGFDSLRQFRVPVAQVEGRRFPTP